jgi:hypothetical protein
VELVYAFEYKQALAQAESAQHKAKALEGLMKQLAWTTPRGGEWERSYRNLQEQARKILVSRPSRASAEPGVPAPAPKGAAPEAEAKQSGHAEAAQIAQSH